MKFIEIIKGPQESPGELPGAKHLTINLTEWPGFAKF